MRIEPGTTNLYRKECLETFIIPMLATTPYHGVSWAGTYQSYHSEHVVLTTSREFNDRDRNGVSHGFSSLHAGGAFFLMGDGHVRFVADTIDNTRNRRTASSNTCRRSVAARSSGSSESINYNLSTKHVS